MNGVEEGREPYSEEHPLRPKNMADTVLHEDITAAETGCISVDHWGSVDLGLNFRSF